MTSKCSYTSGNIPSNTTSMNLTGPVVTVDYHYHWSISGSNLNPWYIQSVFSRRSKEVTTFIPESAWAGLKTLYFFVIITDLYIRVRYRLATSRNIRVKCRLEIPFTSCGIPFGHRLLSCRVWRIANVIYICFFSLDLDIRLALTRMCIYVIQRKDVIRTKRFDISEMQNVFFSIIART